MFQLRLLKCFPQQRKFAKNAQYIRAGRAVELGGSGTRERGRSPSHTKACSVTPVNFVSLNHSQQQFVLSSRKVILRLFKDIHKSISWSAKKRQLTGNIIIRPRWFVSHCARKSYLERKRRGKIARGRKII